MPLGLYCIQCHSSLLQCNAHLHAVAKNVHLMHHAVITFIKTGHVGTYIIHEMSYRDY